jgi:hypothetical protein
VSPLPHFGSYALITVVLGSAAQAEPPFARADACRTVHGRMELWNGTPSVRIWVVGTHRILGVTQQDETFSQLPRSITSLWNGKDTERDWNTAIYADFEVCAVTEVGPGSMQMVRVVDAHNAIRRPRP